MDVVLLRSGTESADRRQLPVQLITALWWLLVVSLWLAAGLFLARRSTGALRQSLAGANLLGIAAGLVAVVALARWLGTVQAAALGADRKPGLIGALAVRRQTLVRHLAVLPPVVVLLSALTLPATNTWIWLAAWGLLIGSESVSLWAQLAAPISSARPLAVRVGRWLRSASAETAGVAGRSSVPWESQPVAGAARAVGQDTDCATAGDGTELLSTPALAEWEVTTDGDEEQGVTQRWSRGTAEDGSEWVAGWTRLTLAAGERTAVVHIPFCPPFPRVPEVSCEILAGPDARIRLGQPMPHGVRVELRVNEMPDEPTSIVVGCSAMLPFASGAAGVEGD